MIERAIRQRWNIPPELREQIPVQLGKVITSGRASHRNKVAAARALFHADALNLEQEKHDGGGDRLNVSLSGSVELTDEQRFDRLRELAERIRRRRAGATDANGTG
jgi:hypothetical protein